MSATPRDVFTPGQRGTLEGIIELAYQGGASAEQIDRALAQIISLVMEAMET